MFKTIRCFFLVALVISQGYMAFGSQESFNDNAPLELNVLHVNDTHSKFDPSQVKLSLDLGASLGKKTVYVEMGGYAQLADAVATLKAESRANLFVHAGDFVQGTLYYTKYLGEADMAFWNMVGLDCATLGNHEFDKGYDILRKNILDKATFPFVSANIDFQDETLSAEASVAHYLIKEIGGSRVGIIGLTTTDVPHISSPGDKVQFLDATTSAQNAIDRLTAQGVNKIIILTHLGYMQDLALAKNLAGADLIVGGHSHTFLGDFQELGAGSLGAYPTEATGKDGGKTLVVQDWEWGKSLGNIKLNFDAQGQVASFSGAPKALIGTRWFRIYDVANGAGEEKRVEYMVDGSTTVSVKEYDGKSYAVTPDSTSLSRYIQALEATKTAITSSGMALWVSADPNVQALVDKYGAGVKEMQGKIVAEVKEDMRRMINDGPGPLIADAMKGVTGADVAVMNPGGVRTDLAQGPLSVAAIYEVQPFGNTLVTVKLTGEKLLEALEDMVAFSQGKLSMANPYVYVSGIRFTLDPEKEKDKRISEVQLETAAGLVPFDSLKEYSVVVNSFMASGGDKNDILKEAPGKYDTGFIDSEAFMTWFGGKTLEKAPARIKVIH
ncbi:MAG: 5'-nucleotidase C-terminal domain-containing protein [Pseudomonadota bacterium]